MNLMGQKIKHKAFGVGTVTAQDESHITIEFPAKTSTFVYPAAFENFLIAEDPSHQQAILDEIQVAKDAIAFAKAAEAAAKAEAIKAAQEMAAAKSKSLSFTKKYVPTVRKEGQHLTYLVFQGDTFDEEFKGQFIWAPQYTKDGRQMHHWDRLMDVREGDIILHCANGYIQAISKAMGSCEECIRPNLGEASDNWETAGRMVRCDYTQIRKPIKTAVYKEDILKYCQVKYAPFDKDGNGNMGYLYDIAADLAKVFLQASAKANKEVADLDYIQWLLVD